MYSGSLSQCTVLAIIDTGKVEFPTDTGTPTTSHLTTGLAVILFTPLSYKLALKPSVNIAESIATVVV